MKYNILRAYLSFPETINLMVIGLRGGSGTSDYVCPFSLPRPRMTMSGSMKAKNLHSGPRVL